MFRIHFMPSPYYAALEQAERGFDGIGVHVAMSVVPCVVNRAMLFPLNLGERPRVDLGLIGHNDFYARSQVVVDNLADCLGCSVSRMNHAEVAIPLSNADNNLFVRPGTPAALLAAYIGFIYLYCATFNLLRHYVLHGCADTMAEVPRGLIAHSDRALNLASGHSLFGFTEKRNGNKPLPQRQVRIMEDSCLLYTSPSPRDLSTSRMPSSA